MPYKSFRDYLERLEADSDLAKVDAEVDVKYEISAICRRVCDSNGPALLFRNLKGYKMPMAKNLYATRERFAKALETSPPQMATEWHERITKGPIEPRIVDDGPCKANIKMKDEINLWDFPIPLLYEKDGGHYITAPLVITKDPEDGWRNASVYRFMVHDKKTLGIETKSYRHFFLQFKKAEAKGERFPIAIAIGVDPLTFFAAVAPFAYGVDEIAMAGALLKEPVEMVKCSTIPLEVPATSEIVLEGEVLPNVRKSEGPLGEFTGYYGRSGEMPVVEIKAITYRNDPIFHSCYLGQPPTETQLLLAVPMEAEIMRACPINGLKKVHVKEGGSTFICVAQIEKTFEGQANWLGAAILGTQAGRPIKYLILVDEDIDPLEDSQVDWALATRTQPSRDATILSNMTGIHLDPSMRDDLRKLSLTSKMIIDATKPLLTPFPETPAVPRDVAKKVESEWGSYGIELTGKSAGI
ncbi:MAG TPA: UbiD family decarboxylase [Candidatus Bathyarchaeia archaeon]|nr:UbiD family decarboxylase [Candidatus Bathyarchaeia archaeon]